MAEFERRYDEASRKLVLCERDLEKMEDRATLAESKVKQLDADLTQVYLKIVCVRFDTF